MYRAVSLRCTESLKIAVRQKKIFNKFQHEKVRPTDELIQKVIKNSKEDLTGPTFRIQDTEETLLKDTPKIQFIITNDDKKETNGEEYWRVFQRKYQKGSLTVSDLANLFKGIYSEAQYQKYKEAPAPMYTVCCCGILPLCSIGVLSLITGGAFPGLAYIHLTYTASILSFLGGIAWADAIVRDKVTFDKLSWAVVPPLLAWSAIMVPLPLGFAFTATGLTVSMIHDVLLTSYPQWFKSLRYILTVVALISFLPTFFTFVFRS